MFSLNVPNLAWKAFTFVLLGMILFNAFFIWFAVLYLSFIILALAVEQPTHIYVKRDKNEINATLNDVVKLENHVIVNNGIGIVTVADKLPEHFELVSKGENSSNNHGDIQKNLRVFWKGIKPLSQNMSYEVKLTKRGIYQIDPSIHESLHVASLKQVEVGSGSDPLKLIVRHHLPNVRRLRDPDVLSQIPVPLGALAKLGIFTNEFKDLREYKLGDPYNRINWKATARLSYSRPNSVPLVNDYEREGKKTVWFFLDDSIRMRMGSEVDSAFEHAIQAISGLSMFYLQRNCRVALSLYSCGRTILPDTGRRQEYKIARELLEVQMTERHETLEKAIESNKWHLFGQNPLFIVITMVGKDNIAELSRGIKRMRLYSTAGHAQILIIHVMGYDIVAKCPLEETGAKILDLSNLPTLRALKKAGAYVIPWDARTQIIQKLVSISVRKR